MHFITVEPGLQVRFPAQGREFTLGVEIGVLASMLGSGMREFSREISVENLDQARTLAEGFGYRLVAAAPEGDTVSVTLHRGRPRPALRIVR